MAPALKRLRRTITETAVEKKRPSVKRSSTSFANKVLRIVNPELKEAASITSGVPAAGGSVACINQIAQGTDIINRVGRHIHAVSFKYNYQFYPPTGGANSDYISFWIVWDKQPNNAVPAFATVMDLSGAPSLNLAHINTLLNRERFVLLRQHTCFLASGTQSQSEAITGKGYIRLDKLGVVEFNGSATGVPNTGAFHILSATRQNTGVAATAATFEVFGQFMFRDM